MLGGVGAMLSVFSCFIIMDSAIIDESQAG